MRDNIHPIQKLPFLKGSSTLLLLSRDEDSEHLLIDCKNLLSVKPIPGKRKAVSFSEVASGITKEMLSYIMPGVGNTEQLKRKVWDMATAEIPGKERFLLGAVTATQNQHYFIGITREMLEIKDQTLWESLQSSILEIEFEKTRHLILSDDVIFPEASLSAKFDEIVFKERMESPIRYSMSRKKTGGSQSIFSSKSAEKSKSGTRAVALASNQEEDAEFPLDKEVQDLIKEIERINKLYGITIEDIANYINQNVELSKIRITRMGDIILESPKECILDLDILSRAVYILYLRHPEGIGYKYLQDFRKEFLDIYGPISNKSDRKNIISTVDHLIDPMCSDQVSSHVSRIKTAFQNQMIDALAANYYIKGRQGQPKKISLDRRLVIWDQASMGIIPAT